MKRKTIGNFCFFIEYLTFTFAIDCLDYKSAVSISITPDKSFMKNINVDEHYNEMMDSNIQFYF